MNVYKQGNMVIRSTQERVVPLRINTLSLGFLSRLICLMLVASVVLGATGCRSVEWHGPEFSAPLRIGNEKLGESGAAIETAYASAIKLEKSDDPAAVDRYFETVVLSWELLRGYVKQKGIQSDRLWGVYHSSVAKTLVLAKQHGRFDPVLGLQVNTANGPERIPVNYHGFAWKPEDFNDFILVGDCENEHIPSTYRFDGLGVPLIVKRERSFDEPLKKREMLFAATAVITNSRSDDRVFSLNLYAPDAVAEIEVPQGKIAVTRAPTAPFIYQVDTKGNVGFDAFRSMGSTANAAGLYSIKPYQPGKIPLIFVHGLLSDPTTWGTMVFELMSNPEFSEKYQIWAFEYQTGDAFVRSAEIFRSDLAESLAAIDPNGNDPALRNIVVVGHSMGGLVAKLQISSSENQIWDSIANKPLDQLIAPPVMASWLTDTCFFEPQPAIKRVVFIGTPHRGATIAQQVGGWIASSVVKEPEVRKEQHRQLILANPGMFTTEVQKHIPTSIDLLAPENAILQAVQNLPIPRGVALHTILGDTQSIVGQPSDGVVPVVSARHEGVESELVVKAVHTHLQSEPQSIKEVMRILRLHARVTNLPVRSASVTMPVSVKLSDRSIQAGIRE